MLRYCFKTTLPVLFGYVPLGIAFGLLFQDLGFHWGYAILMSIVVFAGAAQFVSVGLLAAGAGPWEITFTSFILNSRHMFYGLSLLNKYKTGGFKNLYKIFTLTDETYSLITSVKPPKTQDQSQYYFLVGLLNHSYWVLGSAIGALAGEFINFNTKGMDFALTALFTVLLIEQYKAVREIPVFIMALACGLGAMLLFKEHALVISIIFSLILLGIRGKVSKWT